MSRAETRRQASQIAEQWQDLMDTNAIETRADLARYLGVSRTKVTQILKRPLSLKVKTP